MKTWVKVLWNDGCVNLYTLQKYKDIISDKEYNLSKEIVHTQRTLKHSRWKPKEER